MTVVTCRTVAQIILVYVRRYPSSIYSLSRSPARCDELGFGDMSRVALASWLRNR